MLDRLRQFEGAYQVTLFGPPAQPVFSRFLAFLRRAIPAYLGGTRA